MCVETRTINQPNGLEDDKYEGPLTSPDSYWDLELYLSGRELLDNSQELVHFFTTTRGFGSLF